MHFHFGALVFACDFFGELCYKKSVSFVDFVFGHSAAQVPQSEFGATGCKGGRLSALGV